MLRRFLTLGVQPGVGNDDPNGPTAFNEGQLGPLGIEIGPLPASTMPGQWAEAIPTMANFNYLLRRLFTLTVLDEGNPLVDANDRILNIRRLNFRGTPVTATVDEEDPTQANIDVTAGGGPPGGACTLLDPIVLMFPDTGIVVKYDVTRDGIIFPRTTDAVTLGADVGASYVPFAMDRSAIYNVHDDCMYFLATKIDAMSVETSVLVKFNPRTLTIVGEMVLPLGWDVGNATLIDVVDERAWITGVGVGTIPFRVSTFTPWPTPNGVTSNYGATYDGTTITTTSLDSSAAHYVRAQFLVDGTQVGSTTDTPGPGHTPTWGVRNLNSLPLLSTPSVINWFNPDIADPTLLVAGFNFSATGFTPGQGALGNANIYMNGFIYGTGGAFSPSPQTITRYSAPGGIGGAYVNNVALDAFYSTTDVMLGSSDTGHLYVMTNTGGPNTCKMWKFTAALVLVHFWDVADTVGVSLNERGNFYVSHDMIVMKFFSTPFEYVRLVAIDPITFALSAVGTPLLSANAVSQNMVVQLDDCLGLDEIGVFSVCAVGASLKAFDTVTLTEMFDDGGALGLLSANPNASIACASGQLLMDDIADPTIVHLITVTGATTFTDTPISIPAGGPFFANSGSWRRRYIYDRNKVFLSYSATILGVLLDLNDLSVQVIDSVNSANIAGTGPFWDPFLDRVTGVGGDGGGFGGFVGTDTGGFVGWAGYNNGDWGTGPQTFGGTVVAESFTVFALAGFDEIEIAATPSEVFETSDSYVTTGGQTFIPGNACIAPRRWSSDCTPIIPPQQGGYILPSGLGMVPYFIATGETFTVPLYKQALYVLPIDNEGTLVIDGFLIEVS